MGLGLSALVALLLLLPGIAFVFGLNRLNSPSSPPSPFDQHFSIGLLFAVVASLLLHFVGVGIAHAIATAGWSAAPSPAHALLLLSGDLKAPIAAAALRSVEQHVFGIGVYLMALTAAGVVAGRAVNRFVPNRRRADWAQLLAGEIDTTGAAAQMVVLTTEVDHGASTWLYSGYLDDYFIDRDGRLQRVVFRGFAARRLLSDEDDKPDPLDGPTFVPRARWIEIPGEVFVLQMANARTINLDFFFDEIDAADETEPQTEVDDDFIETPRAKSDT
ncbi:MAG: hypothetical protein ABIP49_06460 [Lysobacterales bacterium]